MISDCTLKVKLYMVHCVRICNQRNRIHLLMKTMEPHQALILIDFKMKFEPIYFREKTNQFYGKKGISWHGSVVFSPHNPHEGDPVDKDLKYMDMFYFDHILHDDSTQDSDAVLSIFEALLFRLKNNHSHITNIWIQSDNASCYQYGSLLYGMHQVSKVQGIKLLGFIHS